MIAEFFNFVQRARFHNSIKGLNSINNNKCVESAQQCVKKLLKNNHGGGHLSCQIRHFNYDLDHIA